MQNGHWIPRNILSTRFEEMNCRPQCVACNMFQRGKPDVFALNLLEEYGEEKLKELQQRRNEIIRYFPYEEKIEYYTNKLKQYENIQKNIIYTPRNSNSPTNPDYECNISFVGGLMVVGQRNGGISLGYYPNYQY